MLVLPRQKSARSTVAAPLLDVGLPTATSLIWQDIREHRKLPVIMTARGEAMDRVLGLNWARMIVCPNPLRPVN